MIHKLLTLQRNVMIIHLPLGIIKLLTWLKTTLPGVLELTCEDFRSKLLLLIVWKLSFNNCLNLLYRDVKGISLYQRFT